MKILILETEETSGSAYQLYAEVINCKTPEGMRQLVFSSVWTGAKHPKEHQTKCNFMLDSAAVAKLKELLGD